MNEKIKTCSECGRSLPLSEFNKNRNNKDGYQDRCRECFSKYNAARYAKNPARYKAFARNRRELHPEKDFETRVKACEKNPTRKNAYMAVDAAIKCGVIERPHVCFGCGCPDTAHRIEAHHHDYSKPLDVVWVCTPCHRKLDAARRSYEKNSRWNLSD
ncbi:MAG: hypothetical protein KIC37_07730 [Coriobacteriaceae bacterium]|nr:hypothetical protein [Coriobacteriaceae bacterium]